MAIYPDQVFASCPHCGLPGPYNFKKEKRYTYKRHKETATLEVLGEKEFTVCVKCNKDFWSTGAIEKKEVITQVEETVELNIRSKIGRPKKPQNG